MGKECCYYSEGQCTFVSRQVGMDEEDYYEDVEVIGSEVCCANCDALTGDELEALCDPDIMGFYPNSVGGACLTCQYRYGPCPKDDTPMCVPIHNDHKWTPLN